MRVRVYLKDDFATNALVKKERRASRKIGEEYECFFIAGLPIIQTGKRWYFALDEIEDCPDSCGMILDHFSWHGVITNCAKREIGVYQLKSAKAILDIPGASKRTYSIRITSKLILDMRELYKLIRTGQIQPVESWEKKQVQTPEA